MDFVRRSSCFIACVSSWHTTGVFGAAASESVDGGLRDALSTSIAMRAQPADRWNDCECARAAVQTERIVVAAIGYFQRPASLDLPIL
jgi:hypothetical protein